MNYSRRRLLATGGSVAAGVALAGCSSSSSEERTVGETASNGDLEITFEAYSIDPTLSVVLLDEEGVPETEAEGEPATETHEARDDHEFLVVVVTMENTGEEPVGLPVPGGNLLSTGELLLRVSGSDRQPVPTAASDETAIDDGFRFDGEVLERLALVVGSVQAELPPGESLGGWTPYRVPETVDPGVTELTYSNDSGGRFTWRLDED